MTPRLFFILGVGKSLNGYELYDAMNLFPPESLLLQFTPKSDRDFVWGPCNKMLVVMTYVSLSSI